MLCLAKVYFTDKSPPVVLERYVDFDQGRQRRRLGQTGPFEEPLAEQPLPRA